MKCCPFCGGDAGFNEHTEQCYFRLNEQFKANARVNPDDTDLSACFELLKAWDARHVEPVDADVVNAAFKQAWGKHVASMDGKHDTSGNSNFFAAGFQAALQFIGAVPVKKS